MCVCVCVCVCVCACVCGVCGVCVCVCVCTYRHHVEQRMLSDGRGCKLYKGLSLLEKIKLPEHESRQLLYNTPCRFGFHHGEWDESEE